MNEGAYSLELPCVAALRTVFIGGRMVRVSVVEGGAGIGFSANLSEK